MKVLREESNDLIRLFENIDTFHTDPMIQGIIIFLCDHPSLDAQSITRKLQTLHKPVFGGVFPGIIYKGQSSHKGSMVIGIQKPIVTETFHALEHLTLEDASKLDLLEKKMTILSEKYSNFKTIAVIIDGLSAGVDCFKEQLFFNIGLESNYFGGGAGSLTFERKPCVITNEGLLVDAAIIAFVDSNSGIGVAHGWSPVSQAIKVTEVNKNRIITLNWIPAFEYYKAEVEKLSGLRFCDNTFFDIAKSYPFGITKIGNEMIVRDPIEVQEDGSIVCVGEIPKNSFVHILSGDKNTLINGAKESLQLARAHYKPVRENSKCVTIIIDCISRALFLGDDFQDELNVINNPELIGALTIGEIANMGKSYLELYNKTSVIAILED